jgi:hypothetical protein
MSEAAPLRTTGWRDTFRAAADVALLGIVLTAAALPVVTAGAAVTAGSAAMHHFLRYDRWPTAAESWHVFRRGLLPGLAAVLAGATGAMLLAADLLALRSGTVPGGTVLTALTAVLAVTAAGYAGLVVIALGADPSHGWRPAIRHAAAARPAAVAAAAGVVLLAAVLGMLVHPVLAPVVAGYALFALHTTATHLDRRRGGVVPAAGAADITTDRR